MPTIQKTITIIGLITAGAMLGVSGTIATVMNISGTPGSRSTAVARTPPKSSEMDVDTRVTVWGARPRLVWTAGGRPPGEYYSESAWIALRYQGADFTFALSKADLAQIVERAKAGVCPDICPR